MNPYDIEKAFASIENELMASMIRNMKRHRIDEVREGKQWEMWQALQLKSLEQYKTSNRKKFAGKFSDINGSVSTIISEARAQGNMEQEIEILDAIKKGFKGRSKSVRKDAMSAQFFKLNNRKMDALIRATKRDLQKAEHAILRMADDKYRRVIFNAQVYANSGAGTYEKAVDMATKDMLSSGLNCVEYKNGARHTLKDYAGMALRTASKRAYLTGEGEKRQEWGISTVIMNKRGNPCPLCLPFVGKILIDDVWSGGTAKEAEQTGYQLMSTAMAAGLYHPNCRDSHTTYFEGISTPPDSKWKKSEVEEVQKEVTAEAKAKHAENMAEKCGRVAKYSLDAENKKVWKAKEVKWKTVASNENRGIIKEKRNYVSTIKSQEQKIFKDEIETAVVIDRSGNVIFSESSGATNYVRFSSGQLNKMKGATLTHNHPSNSTFSAEDIELFITNDLYAIRATGKNRTYQLSKLRSSENKDLSEGYRKAKEFNKKTTDAEYIKLKKKYDDGEMGFPTYSSLVEGLNTKLNSMNSDWLKENARDYGYRYSIIERR